MTPNIEGFVTRADANLRPPTSVSRNITPENGGLAAHWGGSGSAPSTHERCLLRWKGWQDFHMDSRGWSDIAYNFGYCNHGFAFAGRGLGIRSAAQGTTFGNDNFYAACWIGGSQSVPTEKAFEALLWLAVEIRKSGAGLSFRPHSSFKSTSCPGDDVRTFIEPFNNEPITEEDMSKENVLDALTEFFGSSKVVDDPQGQTNADGSPRQRTYVTAIVDSVWHATSGRVGDKYPAKTIDWLMRPLTEIPTIDLQAIAKSVNDELDNRQRARLGE